MKKIAIEEHFSTPEVSSHMRSRREQSKATTVEGKNPGRIEPPVYSVATDPDIAKRLLDIGEGRLKDMEESGIDIQVLCLSGGLEALDASEGTTLAEAANNALSKIIRKFPDKFSGFATLAPQDPTAAALELERATKDLGLKGGKINSHVRGEYLDNPKYWVIFEKAEKLDVPIFIHPSTPSPGMLQAFDAYPVLTGSIWGYAAETGLHAMRLICSGVFDKYPALKIILGHMGEALPFWLWRIDNRWTREKASQRLSNKLMKKPSQYINDNFYITTSGMFSPPALLCAYTTLGADKILFAVDYPHEANKEAVEFINNVPICDSDKEKICHLNAEKLLSLK